jgi:hypothetical protein
MKALDTDILTQILLGNPAFTDRVALIPVAEQTPHGNARGAESSILGLTHHPPTKCGKLPCFKIRARIKLYPTWIAGSFSGTAVAGWAGSPWPGCWEASRVRWASRER